MDAGKVGFHRHHRDDMRGFAWNVCAIIALFSVLDKDNTMEAEQLNALSNQLQDLSLRSAELRRYL